MVPVTALNNAPFFTENLEKKHTIKKTVTPQEWSYKFPSASDPDGDRIRHEIKFLFDFSYFMQDVGGEGKEIRIKDLSQNDVKTGDYVVRVTLEDAL